MCSMGVLYGVVSKELLVQLVLFHQLYQWQVLFLTLSLPIMLSVLRHLTLQVLVVRKQGYISVHHYRFKKCCTVEDLGSPVLQIVIV